MSERISPVELFDMANICAQTYRGRPQVPGWTPISGAELKLGDLIMDAMPHINRACVLWHRRRLHNRPSAAAIAFRTNLGTITSRHRPDAEPASIAHIADRAAKVMSAAEGWIRAKSIERLFVTGHHVGGLLAYEMAGRFASEARPVTAVVFGCRHGAPPAPYSTVIEVQHEGTIPIATPDAVEISRQDDYLTAVRRMYETGGLAALLNDPAEHVLITLADPSPSGRRAGA